MKLFQECFFFVIIMCVLIHIFVTYWNGRESTYRTKQPLKWKTSESGNISDDLDNKAFTLSETRNYLTSITNSTLGPTILTNVSTTDKVKKNNTWCLGSSLMLRGRFGNRLFVYASLLGIAHAHNRRVFIQPNAGLKEAFNLQYVGCNETITNWTEVRETSQKDPKLLQFPETHVQIRGQLQSYRYFTNVADIVRQEYTFKDNIANEADAILNDVRAKYRSSLIVGVHVRRGDFLTLQHLGYRVPEKSYFLKAFDWMKSKFPGRIIIFFIASDDLKWCEDNLLGNNSFVMPASSQYVHMAILSKCDHVVMSGGTFGWWCGWLSGGYVIYYTGYMAKDTPYGKWFNFDNFYPRLWIGIGN